MKKKFNDLIAEALTSGIVEVFPWDLEKLLAQVPDTLLLDIREADEYDGAHINDSLHVPRGILEQSCEWDYAETIPELVKSRQRPIVIVCRSGNRSVLAAQSMALLGFEQLSSLKTGVKGWNDADLPLLNKGGETVDPDWADSFFSPMVRADQLAKNNEGQTPR
ncbi:MAG: rhodanese-like domain-containing protein [Granulosicoccus sp.]